MAARGAHEQEDGSKQLLEDPEDVEYFRKRSRMVYAKTFFATLALIIAGRTWLWFRG
jgi:hypothetical protein